MSEYTKHIAKGSNEYLSLAAKTSYVRDYLLSVNNRLSELILIGAENDERKPLADIEFEDLIARDEICEITSGLASKIIPKTPIGQEIFVNIKSESNSLLKRILPIGSSKFAISRTP